MFSDLIAALRTAMRSAAYEYRRLRRLRALRSYITTPFD